MWVILKVEKTSQTCTSHVPGCMILFPPSLGYVPLVCCGYDCQFTKFNIHVCIIEDFLKYYTVCPGRADDFFNTNFQ